RPTARRPGSWCSRPASRAPGRAGARGCAPASGSTRAAARGSNHLAVDALDRVDVGCPRDRYLGPGGQGAPVHVRDQLGVIDDPEHEVGEPAPGARLVDPPGLTLPQVPADAAERVRDERDALGE